MDANELELKRLELDEKRFIEEMKFKKSEADSAYRRNKYSNPFFLAVIGGIIGIASNAIVSYLNNKNNIEQEQKKLETQLILKACSNSDPELNKRNMEFLYKFHLISGQDSAFKSLIKNANFNVELQGGKNALTAVSKSILRAGPSINAPVIAILNEGTPLKVLSRSNGWTNVEAKTTEGAVVNGYISDQLLNNNPDSTALGNK